MKYDNLHDSELSRVSRTDLKGSPMPVDVVDGNADREGEFRAEAYSPQQGVQAGDCSPGAVGAGQLSETELVLDGIGEELHRCANLNSVLAYKGR
jgi:hypothetical protein